MGERGFGVMGGNVREVYQECIREASTALTPPSSSLHTNVAHRRVSVVHIKICSPTRHTHTHIELTWH